MTLLARRSGRRVVFLAALTLLAVSLMASGASALTRAGSFSCQATAATVFNSPLVVANPQNDPCANDSESALAPNVLNTTIGALHAQTAVHEGALPANGDHTFATSSAAGVATQLVPGHTIKVAAVNSTVQEGCAGSHNGTLMLHQWPPSSSVANLTIDGTNYPLITSALTIPIDGVATVYANRTIVGPNSVQQIGLEIDLFGSPALTLAKSEDDFTGNPCGTV